MSESTGKPSVVVVGAGIVGLTSAIELLKQEYPVIIVADQFPGDKDQRGYCSAWAGAHHVSMADDPASQQARLDKLTYLHFKDEIESSGPSMTYRAVANGTVNGVTTDDGRGHTVQFAGGALKDAIMLVEQREFTYQAENEGHLAVLKDIYDEFTILEEHERPLGVPHGVSFLTVTIDPRRYTEHLFSVFASLGGVAYRHSVKAFSDLKGLDLSVLERVTDAPGRIFDATHPVIINCTGLRAQYLTHDSSLIPVRGQTVLVYAPWVKWGATLRGFKPVDDNYVDPVNGNIVDVASAMNRAHRRASEREWIYSYYVPRPDGYVVLGGTRDTDNLDESPSPEISIKIKQRALKLCPSLVHPSKRSARNTIFDLDCIPDREGVGFRPGRQGGLRLESETVDGQLIIHNYGHDGQGFQSCWGSAATVVELLHAQAKL